MKSSALKFAFHLIVVCAIMSLYSKGAYFIQGIPAARGVNLKDRYIPYKEVIRVNDTSGIFIRTFLLMHLINGLMHLSFVVIIHKAPD